MISIGLDVGGTKVLGVVIDAKDPATVLAERRVATPHGGDGLVAIILEMAHDLESAHGVAIAGMGVGVPGLVDRSGHLEMGPHLRHLHDVALAEVLRDRWGKVVAVDNDANCAAVGEQTCGAAVGQDEVVVVTLGTGIGAGIITAGQLLRGARGYAGEPGHMIVVPGGPPCPCGNRGCWEQMASGTALARLAREAAVAGRLGAVLNMVGGDPHAVRGEHVMEVARTGDAEARAVMRELAGWVAVGLATLANTLDPAVLVIGGGLVEGADVLLPDVRERFAGLVLGGDRRPTIPIVPATLGERSGAIGAALLAVAG